MLTACETGLLYIKYDSERYMTRAKVAPCRWAYPSLTVGMSITAGAALPVGISITGPR